jgi:hypothetical protein
MIIKIKIRKNANRNADFSTYTRTRKGKKELVRNGRRKKRKIPLLPLILLGAGATGLYAGITKASPQKTAMLGTLVAGGSALGVSGLLLKKTLDAKRKREETSNK